MSNKNDPKEKFDFKKFLNKIPFLSVAFWTMSVVSIAAVVLLKFAFRQGTFSSKKEKQEFSDFVSAKSAFESRTGVDKEWFQEGIKLPEILLFINTKKDNKGNKKFIWTAQGNRNEIAFVDVYNKEGKITNFAVKRIIDNDTTKFDNFIAKYFSIEENDINTIAEKIGAKTDYINDIANVKKRRDMVFSLIYNTVVGNSKGHIAVTIENKKLKIVTNNDFLWDKIDTTSFVKSMNWVVNTDTLSNKDKFIWASYEQLSNAQSDVSDTTENKFKKYFNDNNAVQLHRKLPVNFLYYDLRKEVLHIGVNEFAETDKKTKQYLSRLKSSPEEIFYLVENDTTLYNLSAINSTENILWGKIDTSKLANGKFKIVDFANDYRIIKTWNKVFLLNIAIFVLLAYVVLSIFYWIFKRKRQTSATSKTKTDTSGEEKKTGTETDFDLSSLTEEEKALFEKKIKPQFNAVISKIEQQNSALFNNKVEETNTLRTQLTEKNAEIGTLTTTISELRFTNAELQKKVDNALEDFKKLSDKKDKDLIENILKTYDKLLKRNSSEDFTNILNTEKTEAVDNFKKQEKFDTIKNNSDFYDKLVKSKKEADLLKLLDDLRKTVKDLPEIESLKKIYNDLSKDDKGKERKKDDIISDLLARIDEYAKGKELLPQFDFHTKNTETLRSISDTYNSTQKQISDFQTLCQKLTKKDNPDFWDRTALSVWAISQLAVPLLKIWKKEVWVAEKADNITEMLKSDLLQIYTTRYFLRDTNEAKTLEDFRNALDKEIPQKLAKYNTYISQDTKAKLNTIDANFKNQLTAALEKIKKFDEFNDKMWTNFVKDFLQKAPTLNEQSAADKAWFFEQLFNITYHTADYLDFIKNNKNIIYCYNYQFLHNDLDLSKTDHYDFQLNHIEKSTTYSNRIFKWADELGIKKLKVLIEKYLIKP